MFVAGSFSSCFFVFFSPCFILLFWVAGESYWAQLSRFFCVCLLLFVNVIFFSRASVFFFAIVFVLFVLLCVESLWLYKSI